MIVEIEYPATAEPNHPDYVAQLDEAGTVEAAGSNDGNDAEPDAEPDHGVATESDEMESEGDEVK